MTDNETPEEIRFVRDEDGEMCGCKNESQLHRRDYSSSGPFYRRVEPEKPKPLREWVFRETGEVRHANLEWRLDTTTDRPVYQQFGMSIGVVPILTLTVREIKPGKIERLKGPLTLPQIRETINRLIDKVEGDV